MRCRGTGAEEEQRWCRGVAGSEVEVQRCRVVGTEMCSCIVKVE
jgi:hypothetical protein